MDLHQITADFESQQKIDTLKQSVRRSPFFRKCFRYKPLQRSLRKNKSEEEDARHIFSQDTRKLLQHQHICHISTYHPKSFNHVL